jgi:hypothetical protein
MIVYVVELYQMSNHNETFLGISSIHSNSKSVMVKYSDWSDGTHYANIPAIENGTVIYYKDDKSITIRKHKVLDMS